MAGLALSPGTLGAAISVADSTALAALSPQGITYGTVAYNVAVGALFQVQPSSAALVTDQVVAISGVSGARWINLSTGVVTGYPILAPGGSSGAPTYSFIGHGTAGTWFDSANGRTVIQSGTNAQLFLDPANGMGMLFPGGASTFYLNLSSLDAGISRSTTDGSLRLLAPANSFGVWTSRRSQQSAGANVASAATVTLGDGNYFLLTGNTTVKGIVTASWIGGTKVVLELPPGITVSHNSGTPGTGAVAILLRSGADLTTAAQYYLELYYNGANWVQPS